MKNYIKEADRFIEKAFSEFEKGRQLKNYDIIRNAAEKGWLATVQAINALFIKKGITNLPKTHKQRRIKLLEIEERDGKLKGIYDRFMARAYILHERCFYDGEATIDEVKNNLLAAKKIIEDIKNY